MPSDHMMPSDRTNASSLDATTKEQLSEAIEALQKLNRDEVNVLNKVLDALSKSTTSSATESTAESDSAITAAADTSTLDNAMNVASRVQEIGFVEFTAGLINGTFDAIVGATLKQMEAYSTLVADLSKSIQQFQTENVTDAQITEYLAQRYPDGEGGTVVRTTYVFKPTDANAAEGISSKTANQQLQEVVESLIAETQSLKENQRLTRTSLGINKDSNLTQFTTEQVKKIRDAIAATLATNMIEQLRQMARDGLARIVVTDGEIMTKLTFKVTATTQQQKRRENYNQNINQTSIGGRAGFGWWGVSASTNNTNININAVNETSFDSATMDVQMIGEVKLRFRTETFSSINLPPPRDEPESPQRTPQ